MPPFASEQFHAITSTNPERAWNALTATGSPLDYLHGMTVDTDWQPGAGVTMALTDQWRLTGEVLAAERPDQRMPGNAPDCVRVAACADAAVDRPIYGALENGCSAHPEGARGADTSGLDR